MDVLFLLRSDCPECEKMVIVNDLAVVGEELYCPHCGTIIPVPEVEDN